MKSMNSSPREYLPEVVPTDKPIRKYWVLLGIELAVPRPQLPCALLPFVKADSAVKFFYVKLPVPVAIWHPRDRTIAIS